MGADGSDTGQQEAGRQGAEGDGQSEVRSEAEALGRDVFDASQGMRTQSVGT